MQGSLLAREQEQEQAQPREQVQPMEPPPLGREDVHAQGPPPVGGDDVQALEAPRVESQRALQLEALEQDQEHPRAPGLQSPLAPLRLIVAGCRCRSGGVPCMESQC